MGASTARSPPRSNGSTPRSAPHWTPASTGSTPPRSTTPAGTRRWSATRSGGSGSATTSRSARSSGRRRRAPASTATACTAGSGRPSSGSAATTSSCTCCTRPTTTVPIEETWAAMQEVQREGLARAVGLSNHERPSIERAEAVGPVGVRPGRAVDGRLPRESRPARVVRRARHRVAGLRAARLLDADRRDHARDGRGRALGRAPAGVVAVRPAVPGRAVRAVDDRRGRDARAGRRVGRNASRSSRSRGCSRSPASRRRSSARRTPTTRARARRPANSS